MGEPVKKVIITLHCTHAHMHTHARARTHTHAHTEGAIVTSHKVFLSGHTDEKLSLTIVCRQSRVTQFGLKNTEIR